jgi:exosortase
MNQKPGEAVAAPLQVPATSPIHGRSSWWQIGVLAVLVALLYYDVLLRLIQGWWNDPNFSHGFFVPLFSLFVVWRDRDRLLSLPTKPSVWGIPLIAGSLAMLVVGTLGAELFLSRCSFVFLIAGLTVFFAGWRLFRALLFPWLCLFLMVPLPAIVFNQVTFPLQLLASQVSTVMLRTMDVPVLREGNVIVVPAMPLEVAEACSGIRSLVSLGTLAVIYGYMLDQKLWRRAALVVAAIPIAVFANALRITGTGLVAQYWDPQKAEGFFHEFSGWVIFVFSLGLLFLVHRLLQLTDTLQRPRSSSP